MVRSRIFIKLHGFACRFQPVPEALGKGDRHLLVRASGIKLDRRRDVGNIRRRVDAVPKGRVCRPGFPSELPCPR